MVEDGRADCEGETWRMLNDMLTEHTSSLSQMLSTSLGKLRDIYLSCPQGDAVLDQELMEILEAREPLLYTLRHSLDTLMEENATLMTDNTELSVENTWLHKKGPRGARVVLNADPLMALTPLENRPRLNFDLVSPVD